MKKTFFWENQTKHVVEKLFTDPFLDHISGLIDHSFLSFFSAYQVKGPLDFT